MNLNWSKWGLEFWASIMRHVGTAGMAALAVSYQNGKLDWKSLGMGILAGGVIPTIFTFLQTTPVPDEEKVEENK